MPKLDGNGPMGMGPMTGWGSGFCSGMNEGEQRFFRRGFGKGSARRFGRGMGYAQMFRNYQNPSMNKQEEVSLLKNQANMMEMELKKVEKRINELEANS